ncbi:uncharacterized protein L969DRAFT_88020 [Mixia osmundae IAM 14324]|uniref:uncharacterized protein n=1 Tax=Mixia osmundae (strain CBS 9802 / IAM 14324 / JCM 22182 / KY 12970) TaxID=764103 RepID=UPI0004A55235|nr:uncharacterized protein L969DRAFT_88020 [Mixia osmundae IAM 14324]KEI38748.1 hypothetical protein L969DRAFT_88020 [Mixia osmundae IAM 14324]
MDLIRGGRESLSFQLKYTSDENMPFILTTADEHPFECLPAPQRYSDEASLYDDVCLYTVQKTDKSYSTDLQIVFHTDGKHLTYQLLPSKFNNKGHESSRSFV